MYSDIAIQTEKEGRTKKGYTEYKDDSVMCVLAGHIIKDVYELGDTTVFSLNPVTA